MIPNSEVNLDRPHSHQILWTPKSNF